MIVVVLVTVGLRAHPPPLFYVDVPAPPPSPHSLQILGGYVGISYYGGRDFVSLFIMTTI